MILPIRPDEKTALKKRFGSNYTLYLQNSFEEDQIKNEDGTSVSKVMLRRVMGGYKHERFIKGIWSATKKKKASDKLYESQKSSIMRTKKAETAISA